MQRRVLVAICGMLALPGLSMATDIGVTPTKLVVVDKLAAANKAKLIYVSRDKTAGITKGGGTDVGQISVQFVVHYGNDAATGVVTVPAGATNGTFGWVANKDTVAKYVNKAAPIGPTQAKVAIVKPGKVLKLVAKGLGDLPLDILAAGDPGNAGVQTSYCVTNGAEENCHCSTFTDCKYKLIARGTGAKLVCKTGTGDVPCSAQAPPPCYADTGLTVIDSCNGLEWEKKNTAVDSGADPGNLHDVDNVYTWAGQCTINTNVDCQPNAAAAATCTAGTGGAAGCAVCGVGDGTCNVDPEGIFGAITTIWDWVNQLNASNFAGHADWRLPTSAGTAAFPTLEPAELESIVDAREGYCGLSIGACIDPIFGPTYPNWYWSASPASVSPGNAWMVAFYTELLQHVYVTNIVTLANQYVRAVRTVGP